jgi:glycosyltransferase involved in cell wall biosynthesis
MRVLAVSQLYPRRDNGSYGIFIHRLNRGLQANGMDVEVIQRADWAPPWPVSLAYDRWRQDHATRKQLQDEIDGIRVHHPFTVTPRPSRFFPGDIWDRDSAAMLKYARRKNAVARPDIVLGHFLVPDGFHAIRLARSLGVPAAVMAWGDDAHAWPAQWLDWRERLRWVLKEADLVIACSHRLAADANAWAETPRDDWNIVYGGVDLDVFSPTEDRQACRERVLSPELMKCIGRDGKIVVTLALSCVAKGYQELLDAWAQARGVIEGWRLVMAGAEGGDLNVPQEIAKRGLDNTAFWIGPQDPTKVPDLLRASDGFVLASHNEGLSLSVLEALATGLPTITTDVGGHAEVITSGCDGWLVPPKDTRALQLALAELMSSPGERVRRGMAARSAAERIGSPGDNAMRLAELLRRSTHRLSSTSVRVSSMGSSRSSSGFTGVRRGIDSK